MNLVKFFGCLRDLRYASEIYRHTTGLVVEIATVFKNTLFRMYSAKHDKTSSKHDDLKKKLGQKFIIGKIDLHFLFVCKNCLREKFLQLRH